MESWLGESVSAGVDRLPFSHQRLGPSDDVTHTVDEALLLRWQDELIVHLEDKVTKTLFEYMTRLKYSKRNISAF